MDGIDVLLRDDATGGEAGLHALPSHTRERLIADAHMSAIVGGALPNDGEPLAEARLRLDEEGDAGAPLEVTLRSGSARYRRRYPRLAVWDDVQVLMARLSASGALVEGRLYRYELAPRAAEPAPRAPGLRIQPFARSLPPLPRVSLRDAGIAEIPPCGHPALFLPRRRAEALLAQAAATPEVEVGALLMARPFLIDGKAPRRLGIYLEDAMPLAEGTEGSALALRIPPAALAAAPADGLRAGLAHSHPGVEPAAPELPGSAAAALADATPSGALWLSAHDKAFATAFWWQPWHVQIVVDPQQRNCRRALGAFCWIHARIARVCFELLDQRIPEGEWP